MGNSKAISLLKFSFRQDWSVLMESLSSPPSYETQQFSLPDELINHLEQTQSGLILASLICKEDLIQIATLIKLIKKNKQPATKVVVINFSRDRNYEKAMAKLGVMDFIDPSISARALKFKLDFWMRSLQGQLRMMESASSYQTRQSEKKQNDNPTAVTAIRWEEPLVCEDDVWLTKAPRDCRKILSKFIIRILGPSPLVGSWMQEGNDPNLWVYKFKGESATDFIPKGGSWYFHGAQKPEFIWKENRWLFSGEEFELYYRHQEERLSRFKASGRTLIISKNSEFAQMKLELLLESFEQEVVFRKYAARLSHMEGEGESSLRFRNLSGRGKTDSMNSEDMSGDIQLAARSPMPLASPFSGELPKGAALALNISPVGKALSGEGSAADQIKTHYQTGTTGTREPRLEEAVQNATVITVLHQDKVQVPCELEDFFDDEIVLSTEQHGLDTTQLVQVKLSMSYLEENFALKFAATILEEECDSDGKYYLTLKRSDGDTQAFDSFMELYQRRQENINYFLRMAKGS